MLPLRLTCTGSSRSRILLIELGDDMKKRRTALLTISLICSVGSAEAEPGLATPFKIAKLFPREHAVDLITDQPISSPMRCSRNDAVRIVLTAANYAVIASTLMTAFASDKTVTVWLDSCDTDGVGKLTAASVER